MNAGPKVVSKIKDISWLKKKQLTVVSGTVGGGLTAFRFWATMVGYNEVGVVLPRLWLGAGSELSRTELIPNKEAASQIQLELWLRLRSWLKPAWPSS